MQKQENDSKKSDRDYSEHYDYSKSFSEQIDDYQKGKIPKGDTLVVGGTPKVLTNIGLNSLPMTINATHVDYALNGAKDFDHFLGKEGLKQLPDALKNPVAIISSRTKNKTSLIAMLRIRQNGKQIVVPIVIDGYGMQNGIRIDSNAITSVYGKDFSISRVLRNALESEAKNNDFSVYYVDIQKATDLFQRARVLMPKMPKTKNGGYVHSIRDSGSKINISNLRLIISEHLTATIRIFAIKAELIRIISMLMVWTCRSIIITR